MDDKPVIDAKPLQESSGNTLEDALVLSGLFGTDKAKKIIESIEEEKKTALSHHEETCNMKRGIIEEEIEHLNDAKAENQSKMAMRQAELESIEEEIGNKLTESETATSSQVSLLGKLQSKRATYPDRILRKKTEAWKELSGQVSDLMLEEEKKRLEREKVLHEIAHEGRKLNEDEFNRRIEIYTSRKQNVERQLDEHDKKISQLRRIGVTRTTAGFLVWGGYLAFTAFGWYIGEIIRQLHQSSGAGVIQRIFDVLFGGIQSIFAVVGTGWGLFLILLFPIVFLVMLMLLMWGADRFLSKFDHRWKQADDNTRRQDKRFRAGNSFWSVFNNPRQPVARSDYLQALAKLPLLFVGLLAPLILLAIVAVSGSSTSSVVLSDPWKSVLYTYFGVVFCIIMASFAILYATRIIEPRLRSFLDQDKVSIPKTLSTNFEIVLLGVLILTVLLPQDFIKSVFPSYIGIWASNSTMIIILLIGIAAFAVAYGLIYRGIFRDHDNLRRESYEYENRIQKYAAFPVVEISNEEVKRYRNELDNVAKVIDKIWNSDALWRRPDAAFRFFTPTRTIFKKIWPWSAEDKSQFDGRHHSRFEFINADEQFEPKLVADISLTIQRVRRLDVEIEQLRTKQNTLYEKTEVLSREDWEQKILEAKRRQNELIIECRTKSSELNNHYHEKLAKAENAYRMGLYLSGETINLS